jgi:hypothetical protein
MASNRHPYIRAAFGVMLALAVSSARADVVFTNLGPSNAYNTTTYNVIRGSTADPGFGSADQANAFTIGPTDYVFTTAQLALDFCGGGALHGCGGTNQISILLMSDTSGNLPGSVLETIPLAGIPDIGYPASGALVTANAVAPFTLRANTTYWLGATVSAPDSYFGWFVNTTGDHLFATRDNGGSWNPPSQPAALAAAFQINGSPVPEPSNFRVANIALGISLLGSCLIRRRRQTHM